MNVCTANIKIDDMGQNWSKIRRLSYHPRIKYNIILRVKLTVKKFIIWIYFCLSASYKKVYQILIWYYAYRNSDETQKMLPGKTTNAQVWGRPDFSKPTFQMEWIVFLTL